MSMEQNKRVARIYHDLNPDDVEKILTPDFHASHAPKRNYTWRRDDHKRFLSNHPDMRDVIHEQIAEGDWVATRFARRGTWQGRHIELDVMHFKRFEEGKIAEIWEYFDSRELDE